MSKKANSDAASKTTATSVDLGRLTQSQVSWLIGQPTHWLRSNSQLFLRDDDGRYDARQVVEAVQNIGLDVAELADEHLEPLQQWVYLVTGFEGALTGCLRVIHEIENAHGAAGLAAIGELVRSIAADHLKAFPEQLETTEFYRARCQAELDRNVANHDPGALQARRDMRALEICDRCGKYRWGRQWREKPLPDGYLKDSDTRCPDCRVTTSGPRGN